MTDKEFIKDKYLPQIEGKILYVGVLQNYDLHPFVKTPELFETIDLDPNISKGMSPHKHHVGDFLDFENKYKYDHISLHGLWGNGFVFKNTTDYGKRKQGSKNLTEIIINSINKAHNMLNVGGTLQIGPNTNNINKIYDYMVDKNLYKSIFRINRDEGNCANCIFWGEKLNDNEFDYTNNDIWDKTIETKGFNVTLGGGGIKFNN
tara:strand:+ start:570 stop:1184 length:615 start_codon:yes stop_codon:yes gene_type:complete